MFCMRRQLEFGIDGASEEIANACNSGNIGKIGSFLCVANKIAHATGSDGKILPSLRELKSVCSGWGMSRLICNSSCRNGSPFLGPAAWPCAVQSWCAPSPQPQPADQRLPVTARSCCWQLRPTSQPAAASAQHSPPLPCSGQSPAIPQVSSDGPYFGNPTSHTAVKLPEAVCSLKEAYATFEMDIGPPCHIHWLAGLDALSDLWPPGVTLSCSIPPSSCVQMQPLYWLA